jgi:PIN domain nuclease of toxin-antitoxin system
MYYITDTHPLIWTLCADHRLGYGARDIFEQATQGTHTIFIPAVVLSELIVLAEQHAFAVAPGELLQTLTALQQASNYVFLPLQPSTVIASHTLNEIPDIFDRLIVAEARRLKVAVITCDPGISGSGLVDVVWE